MLLDHGQVDAVEQPVQLLGAERDRVASVRPDEAVGFESPEQQ